MRRANEFTALAAAAAVFMGAMLLPARADAAENTDWAAQFRGLKSVVVGCQRTIKQKYASTICERVRAHAVAFLKKQDIPHADIGTWFSQDPRPDNPADLDSPMNLTIHVRSTGPNPLGMDVRINAEVHYRQAVELGQAEVPRSGVLVIWQEGVTGSGPIRQLQPAIVNAAQKDLDGLLDLMKAYWGG